MDSSARVDPRLQLKGWLVCVTYNAKTKQYFDSGKQKTEQQSSTEQSAIQGSNVIMDQLMEKYKSNHPDAFKDFQRP